jgi:hypothetical protein
MATLPTPIPPPSSTNVSALTSPDIVKNIKSSQSPKAFGDQIKDTAKQKIITSASQSTLAVLYSEKASLIKEEVQLDINHKALLLKIENQYNIDKKQAGDDKQKLSEIEKKYENDVSNEEKRYTKDKTDLNLLKEENQKAIDDYLKDPFKKIKEKAKKQKAARAKARARNKAEKRKAKREKTKAIIKNGAKAIAPVLGVLLSNRILEVISQNNKLQKLIDDANAVIEDANISNDPTKLSNAKIIRDNAIRVIELNEQRITRIQKIIETYTRIATVLSGIITAIQIILSLNIPPLIPLKIQLQPILQKISQILAILTSILASILIGLQSVIQRLADLKAQLLPINGALESNPPPTPVAFGTDYGEYKGFKFALREETGPKAVVVRGNKRHFAVAINKQNVEQLKSEPSFTLDPNDLIEQLKLVIDQQNLQG